MATRPREHIVKRDGATLSSLAKEELKGKAVISVLNALNPSLKGKRLAVGTKVLHLTTREHNANRAEEAVGVAAAAKARVTVSNPRTPNGDLHADKGLSYKGVEVKAGQYGVMRLSQDVPWYTRSKDGKLVEAGELKRSTVHRVMGRDEKLDAYVLESGRYVKDGAGDFTYDEVPASMAALSLPATGTGSIDWADISLDVYRRPTYRRTSLRYKDDKGAYTNVIELRLNAFGQSLMNDLTPFRTNGGWFVNIVGEGLSSLQMTGWFVNSFATNEFEAFMVVYHKELKAYRSGFYTKAPIVKVTHKTREYTGIIRGFSWQESAESRLRVGYTLDFLVIQEKALTFEQLKTVPAYTNKDLRGDQYYYADLKDMFTNTVTGATSKIV